MKKYVMNGKTSLVVFFEKGLRTFSPGEVVEANETPHEWFKLLDPPKPKPKATPKIHISKERVVAKKGPLPKVDLPTDKF